MHNEKHKKLIFVVDDDRGIYEPLVKLLEAAQYRAEAIIDVRTTIGRVEDVFPDLVLLDVSMPGADGRDICIKLKKNESVKHIPIILMSAHNDLETGAQDAGANGFIAKPFSVHDLLHKIREQL